MTRLLFFGDTAGTGFGTVTRDLGRALLGVGVDVRFMSLNEQPAGELEEPFAGRTALLGESSGWLGLDDAARAHARISGFSTGSLFEDGWAPDVALVVGDIGSLKMSPLLDLVPPGFPLLHYVPIEGIGSPPRWREVFERVVPVAMSEFGADEIERITGTRPPVIYHGVDTDDFYPVSAARPIVLGGADGSLTILRSKADCKRALGWNPDELHLFRADRHMPRKRYASLLRSVAPVLAAHADVRLIWHCRTVDQGGDLLDERSKYPAAIGARMQSTGFHDRFGGVERKILNVLYNAADLYVTTSAEGFGLCIAEALAAGTPAIGPAYSAVPEVIGPAGAVVPVAGLVDTIYGCFWCAIDEPALTEAIEFLVTHKARRLELGRLGPAHVGANFSWQRAAEQFRDLAASLARSEAAA